MATAVSTRDEQVPPADQAPLTSRRDHISRAEGWRRRGPLLPALIFMIVVTQIPFVFTLYYSTQSWNLVRPGSRAFVGLDNYAAVFADSQFWRVTANTIVLIVGTVIVSVLLGLMFALLLDRKFLGRGVVRTLLITPFLVTPVASALLWKTSLLSPTNGLVNWALSPFGIHTDWLSEFPLMSVMAELVWQWTPFMMLLILAGLQSMPRDIQEAARVDGANAVQRFRHVTIPGLSPVIFFLAVTSVLTSFQAFDLIRVMTGGGPINATNVLIYRLYEVGFGTNSSIGRASVIGLILFVIMLVVTILQLRYLERRVSYA